MATNVAVLHKRLQVLETLRQVHEPVWLDCFDYSWPIRGSGLQGGAPLDAQQAMDRKARLLHTVATEGGRTLAAAVVSGATPSSSVWALLSAMGGTDEAGKAWLEWAGKMLHEEIHASTFDAVAFECAMDLVAAGWFALYVYDNERGLAFTQWEISSVFASTTIAGGPVDTVFRKYSLTAEQAVKEFGENNVSTQTAKMAKESPDTMVQVCHAIYPRTTYLVGAKLARNMPIASCHFEVDSKHLLRESGYNEMPVIVPRWAVIPASVYAIGPMFDALPDARELNEFLRMDKMNAELAIAGMWIAEDDGVLNPRTVKVGPRKIITANSVDSMKLLSAGGNWQLAEAKIAQYEGRIRRILMADQLQPQDGPAMTATEVHVRVNMIRQLLGPIYGRLQAEYLAPLVERCFGLAYRAGLFGMAPESLGGASLRVKYNNPLARAQKMDDVGAIERLNANVVQLAEIVPDALDNIDFDEQTRMLAEALGVPLASMRPRGAVVALREQRSKAQQQQAQQAQQQEMRTQVTDAALTRAAKAA